MGRLIAAVYDRFTEAGEEACLREWRAGLLGDLSGAVLEVGAGTGLNLPFYPPAVTRLVLSEPDRHMRDRLAQPARDRGEHHTEVVDASLERLPMPDATFDAVVSTVGLCSVPRLERALDEIRRVLRPGGRFVFLETGQAIETAGFDIVQQQRESMRKAWPLVRPTIRGHAIKPRAEADPRRKG